MSKHVVLALALFACGKDKGTPASDGKPSAPIDTGAVNALVPAGLKDKLTFEKREIKLDQGKHSPTFTVAAPKGWEQRSKMFGNLEGKFGEKFSVGVNCNGECKEKNWEQESDKSDFQPLAKGKISKDEKKPGQRTMIAELDENGFKKVVVVRSWWTDGEKQYHFCRAELDDEIKDAAPAFEKACSNVTVVED